MSARMSECVGVSCERVSLGLRFALFSFKKSISLLENSENSSGSFCRYVRWLELGTQSRPAEQARTQFLEPPALSLGVCILAAS